MFFHDIIYFVRACVHIACVIVNIACRENSMLLACLQWRELLATHIKAWAYVVYVQYIDLRVEEFRHIKFTIFFSLKW